MRVCVTLETFDDDGFPVEVTRRTDEQQGQSISVGYALGEIIQDCAEKRKDSIVANLIDLLWSGEEREPEYYPGYNEAISDLLAAASKISRGWSKVDSELN